MAEGNLRNRSPGFHFCPTDIESITYVWEKNHGVGVDLIPVYDINKCKPDMLPKNCSTKGKQGELYFFTERDPNKSKHSRLVGEEGFWKNINSSPIEGHENVGGQKTTLVFYTGKGKERKKTDWIMKEYSLIEATSPEGSSRSAKETHMVVSKFVLCEIYKVGKSKDEKEQVSSNSVEDAILDEDRNDSNNKFWPYIYEHADDKNILECFL